METCTAAASSPHASLGLGACSLKGGVGGSSPPQVPAWPWLHPALCKVAFQSLAGLSRQ